MRRRLTIAGFILTTGLLSCTEKEPILTPRQIHARVDSLVGAKMPELRQQAWEDLDRRRAIEVKEKTDSIVQSVMAPIPEQLLDKTRRP